MSFKIIAFIFLLCSFCLSTSCSKATKNNAEEPMSSQTVYVGTYTDQGSEGIYVFDLDVEKAKLTLKHTVGGITNPSFLVLDSQNRYLFSVNESGNTGSVMAFRIDPDTDNLQLLNEQPSHGMHPCHLDVDTFDENVIVSNYTGGNVAIYPITQDGSLGEAANVQQHSGSSVNPQRQKGPHAHSTTVSPDGKYAYSCDLGIDKIMIYKLLNGQLVSNEPAFVKVQPGAGPRHFTFHPNEKFAYVINELNATITMFEYDAASGALTTKQTVKTLPNDYYGANKCADIHVTPNGKFLYGSNRGHDSLAIYKVNAETGELTFVGHQSTGGKAPRNFGIDPSGRLLLAANQDSHNIVTFLINSETGELTKMSETAVSKPVCVKFMQR